MMHNFQTIGEHLKYKPLSAHLISLLFTQLISFYYRIAATAAVALLCCGAHSSDAFAETTSAKTVLASMRATADTQITLAEELKMGVNRLTKACSKPTKEAAIAPDLAQLDEINTQVNERKSAIADYQSRLLAITLDYQKNSEMAMGRECSWLDKLASKLPKASKNLETTCQIATKDTEIAKSMTEQAKRLQASSSGQHDSLLEYIQLERVGCLDTGFSRALVEKFSAMQTDQDTTTERLLKDLINQANGSKR
jgi:hypothetical protein